MMDAWARHRAGEPLSALEQKAAALVARHPEYHAMVEDPARHVERDYGPEGGEVNPFLHLSLHLAVAEQLDIDQPTGLRAHFERLCATRDEHAALHVLIDCLGETLWQAQRLRAAPDAAVYFDCLRRTGNAV